MTWPANRRHKYSAQRTEIDGIKFASKKEAEAYAHLKLWKEAGRLKKIELQPRFPFPIKTEQGRPYEYRADFRLTWDDGSETVVDVKGQELPLFKLKWAMLKHYYPNVKCEKWRWRSGNWETE